MWNEFKTFISRGNVMDLAVGVIIGAAFGKIVSALVDQILMPIVSLATAGVDLKEKFFITLKGGTYATASEATKAGAAVMNFGAFFQEIITFLIVAFVIFMIVKGYNSMKKAEAPAPAAPVTEKPCPHCMMPIPIAATRCGHCTSQLA